MGKIISIINNKGGVGKTSSTGILAELLAFTGCRILCIDLDQQSNLSMLFNCYVKDPVPVLNWRERPEEENITELFRYRYRSREEIEPLIKPTFVKNLYMIPSSKRHQKTPDQIIAEKSVLLKRHKMRYLLLNYSRRRKYGSLRKKLKIMRKVQQDIRQNWKKPGSA